MSIELARRAAAGQIDGEVIAWLADGLRRHLAGHALDQALHLDRASRLRERNQALQDAAALLKTDDYPWHTACRLSQAIARFEARIVPLIERDPGRELSPLDTALQRAHDTGQRLPTAPANLLTFCR